MLNASKILLYCKKSKPALTFDSKLGWILIAHPESGFMDFECNCANGAIWFECDCKTAYKIVNAGKTCKLLAKKDENFADIDYSQILERAQLSEADADAKLGIDFTLPYVRKFYAGCALCIENLNFFGRLPFMMLYKDKKCTCSMTQTPSDYCYAYQFTYNADVAKQKGYVPLIGYGFGWVRKVLLISVSSEELLLMLSKDKASGKPKKDVIIMKRQPLYAGIAYL